MIARLVRSADFERVLRTRTRVSSLHFAVHHVADRPSVPAKRAAKAAASELSTGELPIEVAPVDDFVAPVAAGLPVEPPVAPPESVWLGTVVPKRHAKRSVTRSLLKRQIRRAITAHAASLAAGLWVVRLRAPFDKARFVSAASDELQQVARDELDGLIGSAARRVAAGA